MENYIVINGKKAELTEEQLEKLGIKFEKNKYKKIEMFTRIKHDKYFFLGIDGTVSYMTEEFSLVDGHLHCVGNYCKDISVMKQRALHETLNRLLWRASVIAGELDNEWTCKNDHYYIYRDFASGSLRVDYSVACKDQGACYFPTEDSAHDAIENIIKPFMEEHPDFVW